eukprot:Tamp_13749.p1 GENE.Tamp_13749~~Tamp_13749.p1  ORF type:complete len:293 (-),score=54.59 Tamp_13749:809-1687(-)
MATLMEFAAASLERDGGSRALDGSVPPAVVTPPVLHWGSAGRRALDADGKRCVKLLVIASKGAGTRAADMTLDSARLRKEGMLVLDELSMRGGALSCDTPLDGTCSTLWGTSESGGLLLLAMGQEPHAWRGPSISAVLIDKIRAERVIIVHELPLRHTAIDAANEDWGSDGALLRMLSSDAELSRCAAVPGEEQASHDRCRTLESGVVVDGVAAAAISSLHIHAVPAVLYVGLSREPPGAYARGVHEDPTNGLAAALRAQLSRAGFDSVLKPQSVSPAAARGPSEELGNMYL